MIYLCLGLVVLAVLTIAVLLRRRYKAHYDYLVDCSIPKHGTWRTTDEIHQYSLARDVNSDKWSIYAALLRLEKRGFVESLSLPFNYCVRWRWIAAPSVSILRRTA